MNDAELLVAAKRIAETPMPCFCNTKAMCDECCAREVAVAYRDIEADAARWQWMLEHSLPDVQRAIATKGVSGYPWVMTDAELTAAIDALIAEQAK